MADDATSDEDSQEEDNELLRQKRRRESETQEQTEASLGRSGETAAQRVERLAADRLRHKHSRARETREQREARLAADRLRKQRSRAKETLHRCSTRLQGLRSKQAQRLAAETAVQRASRLQQLSVNQSQRLANESAVQRAARLQQLSVNQSQRLANETAVQRAARLQQLSVNQSQRLAAETDAQRVARLQQLRVNVTQHRAAETEAQHAARVTQATANQASRLAAETPQQRTTRLKQMQEARHQHLQNVQRTSISARDMYLHHDGWLHDPVPLHMQPWVQHEMTSFHAMQQKWKNRSCNICHERCQTRQKLTVPDYVCVRCTRDKHTPKLYSAENDMLPGARPLCLEGLSQVEEMLIARACPVMCVYRKPGGQRGYRGHVLNLPQDVQGFVDTLPRCVADLPILLVRRHGVDNTHADFRVRRERVLNALQWLQSNNRFYHDINIDFSLLQDLPADGVPSSISHIEEEGECAAAQQHSDLPCSTQVCLYYCCRSQ